MKPGEGHTQKYFREVVLPYAGDDCLIWPFRRNCGGRGQFNYPGVKRGMLVHRAACIEVHGQPPSPTHQAAHSCGNGRGGCCNPRHVRWATPSENVRECVAHGAYRTAYGEDHHKSKLTEATVAAIRRDYQLGERNPTALARKYGHDSGTIRCMLQGRTWAWLPWAIERKAA